MKFNFDDNCLVEEDLVLKEDSLDQCRSDANSICKMLDRSNLWYELVDYDMYPMNTSKVSFEVSGDWKHDHWAFKDILNDWAEENNRDIFKIDEEEIGESQSDDYVARYDVFITANKDSYNMLNSMRGLFAEGLNPKEKQIYVDAVNEAEDIEDLEDICHEIYFYDKRLFAQINKRPKDGDVEKMRANMLKNLGAVDESLTEDRSLAKPFKKELKNAYKSFDASRDFVRKKNDAAIKTWNQVADGIPMDDNAKNILLKPEPKFSRFKPERSNSLEREEYPFYVTYYEETPYYHPEEGGYYVAGRQAIMSKGFDNKEDALKFAKDAADHFGFEKIDDTWYHLGSRYIGEDDSVKVETKREYLSREEGDSVYESLTEELSIEAKRNALDRINTEGGYAAYDLEDAAMKYQPDAKDLNDLTDDTVEKVYTDLKNDFLNKLKVYGDDADLDGVLYDVFGVSESLNESLGADIDKLEQQISDMKVGDSVIVKNYKNGDTYEFVKRNDSNQISAFENIRGKNHMASPMQVFGWAKDSLIYAHFNPQFSSSDLTEDTIKTKDGKWTNKGDEGTHGKFDTKKEADAQRKAMFANGFHEDLEEDSGTNDLNVLKSYLPSNIDYRQHYGRILVRKDINSFIDALTKDGWKRETSNYVGSEVFSKNDLTINVWSSESPRVCYVKLLLDEGTVPSKNNKESLKEDSDDNLKKLLNDYFRHSLSGSQSWADVENIDKIDDNTYKVDVRFKEEFRYDVKDDDGIPYTEYEDAETYNTYIVNMKDGKVVSVKSAVDESLKEDFFDFNLINYNDFLANNFDGWSDDIDDLMKEISKCARALKTVSNKLIFYVDYDEDFYAVDNIAKVVEYIGYDYSLYQLNDLSGIYFVFGSDNLWIFRNEKEANYVISQVKAAAKEMNESLQAKLDEGLLDSLEDFKEARKNWKKVVKDISFDVALERWNKESELADPDWFAKPIYSVKAWNDMVNMFSNQDDLEEAPIEEDFNYDPDKLPDLDDIDKMEWKVDEEDGSEFIKIDEINKSVWVALGDNGYYTFLYDGNSNSITPLDDYIDSEEDAKASAKEFLKDYVEGFY